MAAGSTAHHRPSPRARWSVPGVRDRRICAPLTGADTSLRSADSPRRGAAIRSRDHCRVRVWVVGGALHRLGGQAPGRGHRCADTRGARTRSPLRCDWGRRASARPTGASDDSGGELVDRRGGLIPRHRAEPTDGRIPARGRNPHPRSADKERPTASTARFASSSAQAVSPAVLSTGRAGSQYSDSCRPCRNRSAAAGANASVTCSMAAWAMSVALRWPPGKPARGSRGPAQLRQPRCDTRRTPS